MIEIFTLGQLRLAYAGETLTGFVSQKTEVLFIYLVCHPRTHQRDVLATTFWGDTTDEQAMKNLRTALASLGKQLADNLIVDRQTISVNPDTHIWIDTRALEEEIAEFEGQEKPSRRALKRLAAALDLYGGDFLPGFHPDNAPELETWVLLERDRLRQMTVEALGKLIDHWTEWGDYPTALTHTYRLLKIDPLNEAGQRRLMRLLTYTGNRNQAIRQFQTFAQALSAELDVEPEVETKALLEQIKVGRLRPALPAKIEHSVPDFASTFVPRPYEIAQIAERLNSPTCRLLTLIGIGGVGKTHLALQAAHEQRDEYQHGIYFVSLAAIGDPNLVLSRIVAALPIRDARGGAQQALIAYLREKHLLLVLDNFEDVLDAAESLSEILREAPHIKLLVTSREPLRLRDEHILRVEGLSLPPDDWDEEDIDDPEPTEQAAFFGAIRLFEMVAQRVYPDFQVMDHLNAVTRICRLVDGLPLGIEIAAAHVQMMPPAQIEAHLHSLTNVHRDTPERHRGLRVLMDDIWKYLTPDETRALCYLAVFPGDFDLPAALAVTQTDHQVIGVLVHKSLLQLRGDRYLLHQVVRHYMQERLTASGDEAHVLAAHAAYYRTWLTALQAQQYAAHVLGKAIDLEYPNLWLAVQSGDANQRLTILTQLGQYWVTRDFHRKEGIDLLRELSAAPDIDIKLRLTALQRLGTLLLNQSDFVAARAVLEEALAAGVSAYPHIHALVLNALSQINIQQGDYEMGRDYAEQIVRIYEDAPDKDDPEMRRTLLLSHSALGYIFLEAGDYAQAQANCLRSVELARELNELRDLTGSLGNLGLIALEQEQPEQAFEFYSEALNIAYEIDHRLYITILSNNLAGAAGAIGRNTEAFVLTQEAAEMALKINYRMALIYSLDNFLSLAIVNQRYLVAAVLMSAQDRLREELSVPVVARDRERYLMHKGRLEKELGHAAYEEAYNLGQQMTVVEATRYAAHHLYDL